MLSVFDNARLYHLDPNRQEEKEKDWSNIAHLQFQDTQQLELIAEKFTDFGDFNLFKDDRNTCYIEFYTYDPDTVKGQNLQGFIEAVEARK